MWTNEQMSLLRQFTETNNTIFLRQLADSFLKEAENLHRQADALKVMADNFDVAHKKTNENADSH